MTAKLAAPMVGEVISSAVLTLGVAISALCALFKQWQLRRNLRSAFVPSMAGAHSTASTS